MSEPWPRSLLSVGGWPPPEAAADPAALALYAALLNADGVAAGARRLAAALATAAGYDRVSVGLHEDGRTRLVACSQIDVAQLPADLAALIEGAMDEALDQGQTLACPTTTETETESASALDFEHCQLQRQVGGWLATVPLGAQGERLAAVCVERRQPVADPAELARLEQQLVLAAPALRWLQAATEPAWPRARRQALRHWAALRQPDRRLKRRLWGGAAFALAFAALVPLDDPVAGRARIEGAEQRVLAAPTDGFIKTAHVRPGDQVAAGAPLLDLLEADLRLERERWASQLAQHENAYAAAMANADRGGAAVGLSRVGEAQAQLALIDAQLGRSRLTAPFDAVVIDGDLSQSIGAPVRQGDPLLTLASRGAQRVIVEVDETDIARVQAGQAGSLAVSALPWQRDDLVVERISPLAKAVDGRNVFEVEARLSAPRAELRAGLLGRADIVTGSSPLLWAGSRQLLLRLRVALWSWLA